MPLIGCGHTVYDSVKFPNMRSEMGVAGSWQVVGVMQPWERVCALGTTLHPIMNLLTLL